MSFLAADLQRFKETVNSKILGFYSVFTEDINIRFSCLWDGKDYTLVVMKRQPEGGYNSVLRAVDVLSALKKGCPEHPLTNILEFQQIKRSDFQEFSPEQMTYISGDIPILLEAFVGKEIVATCLLTRNDTGGYTQMYRI